MLNIYSNGLTLGVPPSKQTKAPAKRSKVTGWSESSTRSNTVFLYSVDSTQLTEHGYAFTFTLRDLPPTPNDWYKIREKFIKRCKRANLIRYHWVTEWQRRGVPHLHGCLYFPDPLGFSEIKALKAAWCSSVGKYYALQRGQDVKPIDSAVGWLKYLAKHGSRSKYHYQRSSKPSEWDSSGRVWGKGGEWPVRHTQHDLGRLFHRFRRLVRQWRIADARLPLPVVDASGQVIFSPGDQRYYEAFGNGRNYPRNSRRIRQARRCLTSGDRSSSTVRGMSEWIPEALAFRMVQFLENGV
jgi:hypothetical protein